MPDLWEERVRAALGAVLTTDEFGADGPRAVADVAPKDWREAVRACRDDLGCDFFDWLSAVDEGPGQGFRIVAHLWSVGEKRGVLLRALLAEGAVDSVVDLYPGADWHERETHEMFGVDFPGHPDLQPLLLAPEFEGHPLRKDFVLASRVVKPWPGAKEPGEGHGTARKRAPKRPPGVPEDWIEPKDDEAASGTREGAPTGKAASDSAAPEPGTTDSKAPDAARADQGASAPDPRLRRPDAS